jgi:hypothetical protein
MRHLTLYIVGLFVLSTCGQIENKSQLDEAFVDVPDSSDFSRIGPGKDLIRIQQIQSGKIGFRDKDSNIVIKPIFEHAELFNEGLSAATQYGRYGYYNPQGYVDQEPLWQYTGSFRNGKSAFKQGKLYGFFNREFDIIIKPQFWWADEFSEGLCIVQDSSGKYAFIDSTGHLVTSYRYDSAQRFKNGQAKVRIGNNWEVLDKLEFFKNK